MMDYDLGACLHCGLEGAKLKRFDDANTMGNCLVAVFCSGCGARGPVRHISPFCDADAVIALAAEDWNTAAPATDLPETSGQGESLEDDAPDVKTSDEHPQVPEPAGGGGGKGATNDTTERPAVAPESKSPPERAEPAEGVSRPDPASNGADRGGASTEIDQGDLAKLVRMFLADEKLSQKAFAEMAGCHQPDVSALIRGAYVSPASISAMASFMASVEGREEGDYDESKIERLPNNYDKLKSGNPLPKYDPPARCSRAP